MSLKAVHLVFVTALSALAFGFAAWSFKNFFTTNIASDLAWGTGSSLAGVAVIVYGIKVFKKLKHLSYL
jgi:membrane protein DedA with SNARE-associated domain